MTQEELDFNKQVERVLNKHNTKQPLSFEEKEELANLLISHGLPITEEFEEFHFFSLIAEVLVNKNNPYPELKVDDEFYEFAVNNIWLKVRSNKLLGKYWKDINREIKEETRRIDKDSKFKSRNKRDTLLSKIYFHLYARWVFILAKHKLEKTGCQIFEVMFQNQKITINFKTLAHIHIRHYGLITKDYDTFKSFFNKNLKFENLLETILDVLLKIENSKYRNEFFDGKVRINLKNLDYFICIKKEIVTTFYPLTKEEKLLELKNNYTLVYLDKDLQLYIKKS